MGSIRPEIRAFIEAAKTLSSETERLPLSDAEMKEVELCLGKLEQALEEGQL